MSVLTIVDFFNPENIAHIRAYEALQRYGHWPEGFVPEDCNFPNNWQVELMNKMAIAWIESMLLAHEGADIGC